MDATTLQDPKWSVRLMMEYMSGMLRRKEISLNSEVLVLANGKAWCPDFIPSQDGQCLMVELSVPRNMVE